MHIYKHHIKRPIVFLAHSHDDWVWFRIWFSVTTVTASIVFNLGIFTALVVGHMVLDIIKYRTKHGLSWHWIFVETLREGLVDVFFIVLGLLLGIAFHYSVAIGGLGRLAKLEVLILNLVLRVGPRLKIAEHILEVVLYWKHHYAGLFMPHAPLSKGEKSLLLATILCTCGILLVPYVTEMTWGDVGGVVAKELTPRLEVNIMHTIDELSSL